VAPTAVQAEAATEVDRQLGEALARWQAVASELPPLNQKIQRRGLAPVDPEAQPMGTGARRNEE